MDIFNDSQKLCAIKAVASLTVFYNAFCEIKKYVANGRANLF